MFLTFETEKYKRGWILTHFVLLLCFVLYAVMIFKVYFLNIEDDACWKEIVYRRVSIEFFSFSVFMFYPLYFLA